MSLVSAAQLTALRSIGYRQLDTPFTVWRSIRVEGDLGTTSTLVQVDAGDGWLRMMNSPHIVEQLGMREGATANFRLHTRVGVDIEVGDEIRAFSNRYIVNDVNDDDTVQVFRTALLRRIQ